MKRNSSIKLALWQGWRWVLSGVSGILILFGFLLLQPVWAVELPPDLLQKMKIAGGDQQTVDLDTLRAQDSQKRRAVDMESDFGLVKAVEERPVNSPLETEYSLRAKIPLTQFGYEMFRSGKAQTASVTGAAPDSYILGVGDELIITMRGTKENRSNMVRVDLEGRVMVPTLMEPMMALGRSFGEFRDELKEKVRTTQVGTEAFVSIGAFRFFSVYVMGEVEKPGLHRVTGLSTLLDALSLAGGVRKTGSSRSIQLHRDGKVLEVDLYAFFLEGGGGIDPTLTVGDRIVVPPLGDVVAVSGLVKRPGIYELSSKQTVINLTDLLGLAGGLVNPAGNRFALRSADSRDRDALSELNVSKNPQVAAGSILTVSSKSSTALMGDVSLEGHVIRPVIRSLAQARTVRRILADKEQIKPDPYLPFGVIYRTNAKTRTRTFVPIDLGMILKREELDVPLMNHDVVIVLGVEDVRALAGQCAAEVEATGFQQFAKLLNVQNSAVVSGANSSPAPLPVVAPSPSAMPKGGMDASMAGIDMTSLSAASSVGLKMDPRLQAASMPAPRDVSAPVKGTCPEVFTTFPNLLVFLLENSVRLEVSTDKPSLYPVLPGARLTDILPLVQGEVGTVSIDQFASLHFQLDRQFGSPKLSRQIVNLSKKEFASFAIQPGDLLRFKFGQVKLAGHVVKSQQQTLQSVPTVKHFLLNDDVFKPNPYLLFGVLRRVDPVTHNRVMASVNLDAIMKSEPASDAPLQDRDILIVLSGEDVQFLAGPLVQSVLLGQPPRQACNSLQLLSDLMASSDAFRFSGAIHLSLKAFEADKGVAKRVVEKKSSVVSVEGAEVQKQMCPEIMEQYPEVLPFLLENVALLTGEVRTPGVFPVVKGTSLSALVQSGGGVTERADLKHVELSRAIIERDRGVSTTSRKVLDFSNKNFSSLELVPGDVLRFSPIFSDREIGYVRLEGEFVRAGLYDIRRADRLTDIIARAGGLTPQAYPYGAIFTRTSIQKNQKESFVRVAQELEMSLASLMMTDKEQTDKGGVMASGQAIIASLRSVEPLGRMVVELNPKNLSAHPEMNLFLEAGDRIFMPKQPSEVSVSGAVLNPGSFLYVKNQSPTDYIKWAGGFKDNANKSATFMVLPDGKAQAVWGFANWWDQGSANLVPGSMIVVPLDPKPFELMGSIKDVTQILSQWAITIASLSVISSR